MHLKPFLLENYANPSGAYSYSKKAKQAIKAARKTIAECINAEPEQIYFTSGGTESDNWAIKGFALSDYDYKAVITSQIEHHAILNSCYDIERLKHPVAYLPEDCKGVVATDTLNRYISDRTGLVSVMTANNEIGTIEPIEKISEIAHKHGIIFHTDAVQAFGQVPINVDECHIDMLSASGHKLNGPKGIGFLYIRKGVKIRSFVHGGAQERKRRAGTENVPGIVGIGTATKRAIATMEERTAKEREMRDYLIKRVMEEIPYTKLNGHPTDRLPNNANFCFRFIEGESMLIRLDMAGICGSSGSACTSGSLDPSHVLLAIGLPHEVAHGSLRLSLSEYNKQEEVDYVLEELDMVLIMTVNPGYGGQSYIAKMDDKIKELRAIINEKGLDIDIEVDGGISAKNVAHVKECGANVFVAGSAVFNGDIASSAKDILEAMEA